MDGWMGGWADRGMDGWIGWMDGWMVLVSLDRQLQGGAIGIALKVESQRHTKGPGLFVYSRMVINNVWKLNVRNVERNIHWNSSSLEADYTY